MPMSMPEPIATPTARPGGFRPAWPPVPSRSGVNLPLVLVLVVFVGIEWVWIAASDVILGDWVSWKRTLAFEDLAEQTAPWVINAAAAVIVVWALRWGRAVGLTAHTRVSAWGVVPVVVFATVSVADAVQLPVGFVELTFLGAMTVNFAISAFTEELVYRGYLVHGLSTKVGATAAILISATLSALVHFLPSGRPIELQPFTFFFVFAILMSRIRTATDSIWYPTIAHALFNVFVTIDQWLYAMGDRWPPGAFVYRGSRLLGLFLTLGLFLRPLLLRAVSEVTRRRSRDIALRRS